MRAANVSNEPYAVKRPNLPNVESPVLGVLAVTGAGILNLSLLAAAVSLCVRAWRAGARVEIEEVIRKGDS